MSFEPKRRRTPVTIGVLGLLFICSCGGLLSLFLYIYLQQDEEEDPGNHQIVYGLTLDASGYDPQINISSELGIPFYSVYDTLVYRHPQNMEFTGGLAESWEMSGDGLVWTFYLKHGVTFHDGTPFNAQAVAYNLDRIANPDTGSGKALSLLGSYIGYEVVDDYTIRILLSEAYAPLLDGLSQVYLGIASPTALAAESKGTYQYHQVGTGPYRLVEFVPGDHITLRANEDYTWGPVFYANRNENSVDTVTFRFYTDPATRGIALESGDVQIIGELLPTDAELLTGNNTLDILQTSIPGTPQQFFFNTTQEPTDRLEVRQALLYATNRTAIADAVFQSLSPVAYGPLAAVTPLYDENVATIDRFNYPYNPQFARALLENVGYVDENGDGMLEMNGVPLHLRMVFAPWNQMADVAQLIQSQWRDVGIDLELVQVPDFPTLMDEASEGDYNLIALYDFGVDASILNQYYLSDGAHNWSHFSDPDLDGWLQEATRRSTAEERAQYYAMIQEKIMEQAVVLPIRDYVSLHGSAANIDGLIYAAQGWWPLLRNLQVN
jgi:peptide/nickel transport system substrate-binding protein